MNRLTQILSSAAAALSLSGCALLSEESGVQQREAGYEPVSSEQNGDTKTTILKNGCVVTETETKGENSWSHRGRMDCPKEIREP